MYRANLVVALSKGLPAPTFKLCWGLLPKSTTALYRLTIIEWQVPNDIIDTLNSLDLKELRETMVICNLDPSGPDPWELRQVGIDGRGYGAILVLMFPEVYFVFLGGPSPLTILLADTLESQSNLWGSNRERIEAQRELIKRYHVLEWPEALRLVELLHLHSGGFRTLFDPCGLRNGLKMCLLEINTDNQRGLMYLPDIKQRLNRRAVSADEEDDYVFMHAYTAYKMGYCVSVLRSEEDFKKAFNTVNHFDLVISDWDLAYADHEVEKSIDPQGKEELLERCTNQTTRIPILIVSTYKDDSSLQKFLRGDEPRRGVLGKPHSGVHTVLKAIEQITDQTQFERTSRVASSKSSMDETVPAKPLLSSFIQGRASNQSLGNGEDVKQSAAKNHSLPYARSIITTHLLQRARSIRSGTDRPIEDGLLQAVLALEAKELLGELSRTTAYDALRLQVEGELLAELSWFGVDFQKAVEPRIADLIQETDRLRRNEKQMGGEVSTLNRSQYSFLYSIVDNLRRRYSNSGQILASEHCLRRLNDLEVPIRKSSTDVDGWGQHLWRWLIDRFWIYVRRATNHGTSVGAVLAANICVIVCATIVFCGLLFIHPLKGVDPWQQFGLAAGHAVFTFAELQPGVQEYDQAMISRNLGAATVFFYRFALLVEIAFAYLNLGLMISVLYRRLMRAGA